MNSGLAIPNPGKLIPNYTSKHWIEPEFSNVSTSTP